MCLGTIHACFVFLTKVDYSYVSVCHDINVATFMGRMATIKGSNYHILIDLYLEMLGIIRDALMNL